MRRVHAVASAAVTLAALAVCCGWPYEVAQPNVDTDADPGDSTDDTATAYDVPSATCTEAGIKSGEAIRCTCPLADGGDGGAETDPDGAPFGHQACTLEGGLGACVGCPETTTCDGVTSPPGMVCIPGGITTLGATNPVCAGGCAIEMPEHAVAVSRFFLDEREVTVKRFRDWWAAGRVSPKGGDLIVVGGEGLTVNWQDAWTVTEPSTDSGMGSAMGATWTSSVAGNEALPINFVDWPTALAFCVANGGRLPTEAEWESAASGREGRLFPRENKDTRNVAPTAAMLPCNRAISAVGGDCGPPAPPPGVSERSSRDGVFDLAGSLAEWVIDVPPPAGLGCTTNCYPSRPSVDPILFAETALRGVRGGAWSDADPKVLRAQARDFKAMSTRSAAIGFRCAKR